MVPKLIHPGMCVQYSIVKSDPNYKDPHAQIYLILDVFYTPDSSRKKCSILRIDLENQLILTRDASVLEALLKDDKLPTGDDFEIKWKII
jgi:hypothetical protein